MDSRHCNDAWGKRCVEVRDGISKGIAQHVDLKSLTNCSEKHLHNENECLCDQGLKGKEGKRITNEKRWRYHNTDDGIGMVLLLN